MEEEHRDIFHGPATETNLELHFKGSDTRKAFDTLKQHPKHIVSLYYEQIINAIKGHLIVKMHCTNAIKTLKKLTSFNNLVLTKGRYNDAFESEEFNQNANNIINLIIIEHYENDYKGQLFETNDKERPIVSDIKDYLAKKDTLHGAVIPGVVAVLMAVALAEVGNQKKTCTNVRAFFNSLALKKVVKYRQIISKRQMILFSHVRHQLHSHICKKQVMTEVIF